jgi:hypothetical protein
VTTPSEPASPEAAASAAWSAPTGRPGDPAWYTRRIELALYLLAGTTYVVLGVFHKFLLNWVIGPVWLVAWVWAVPAIIERFRPRGAT